MSVLVNANVDLLMTLHMLLHKIEGLCKTKHTNTLLYLIASFCSLSLFFVESEVLVL